VGNILLWADLTIITCLLFESKVFVIGLLMFHKHWHKPLWPWLRICKVGHTHIGGAICIFLILLFYFFVTSISKV
jgi:hypothetical protein